MRQQVSMPDELKRPLVNVRWYIVKFAIVKATTTADVFDNLVATLKVIDDGLKVIRDIESLVTDINEDDRNGSGIVLAALQLLRDVRFATVPGNFTMQALLSFEQLVKTFDGSDPAYNAAKTLWSAMKAYFDENKDQFRDTLKNAVAASLQSCLRQAQAMSQITAPLCRGAKDGKEWFGDYNPKKESIVEFFTQVEGNIPAADLEAKANNLKTALPNHILMY
jgi:hypothetical protein